MKNLSILILVLLATMQLQAQNEVDALRYSNLSLGGTARFMATGGAFGALGADISTLHTNPAGIGLYSTSEITISPTLFFGKTESKYNGYSLDDYKSNFNIGNFGMVSVIPASKTGDQPGWKYFQFGVDLVRNNNFHNQISTYGTNTESSLLNAWNLQANGIYASNLNDFNTRLAFDTYLLDSIPGDNKQYVNAAPLDGVSQEQIITTEGYMNEWAFSLGGNYNDKLFLGMTVGLPYLRYSETRNYKEKALSDSLGFNEFKTMRVDDYLETRGKGVNFKFGLIYKPVSFVRIGLAMHTPTNFYQMEDKYRTSVRSSFDNGDNYQADSPNGVYDYKLNTPFRYIGSIAFIIAQQGFISAEYELMDYTQAKLRASFAADFFDANNTIKTIYKSTGILKIGAEYKLENISFRGGYANYGSPYKSEINDGARTSYTFGIGFREGPYMIDFATVLTYAKEDYYLYNSSAGVPLNPVENRTHNQTFVLTLGAKL